MGVSKCTGNAKLFFLKKVTDMLNRESGAWHLLALILLIGMAAGWGGVAEERIFFF